eukprot:CAMPEP_0117752136 /NCGR_PEP_ID=MMETSP0947-20121206/11426_1 /TAXON_ID=44440 /ORGANISM="Chattonella subsalsa, Strain CCMP2191" /LENGTH=249 /DNA_ID=CAMNT_0005570721 /DNA_START=335 /DNA_END=1084 /DNA_ORIENTATION=-
MRKVSHFSTDQHDTEDITPNIHVEDIDWRNFRASLISAYDENSHELWSDDKWAHEIKKIEKGCLLISTNKIPSGFYHKSVVFILSDDSENGTIGLVLNKETGATVDQMPGVHSHLKSVMNNNIVYHGGEDSQDKFWTIQTTADKSQMTAAEVIPELFCDDLQHWIGPAKNGKIDSTSKIHTFRGCTRWLPGELEKEISEGYWYPACSSKGVILSGEQGPKLWFEIMGLMGGKYLETSTRMLGIHWNVDI